MNASDLPPDLQKRLFGKILQPKRKREFEVRTEDKFQAQCVKFGLPEFRREFKFAVERGRLWRFDFAWDQPELKIAVEIEGLVIRRVNGDLVVTGRHVHPVGWRGDAIKYGTAAILGWSVLRFEQTQVSDGTAIDMTVDLLRSKGWKEPR